MAAMSTFVVFTAAVPEPGLDPLPVVAVLTDAESAEGAVEAMVERGVFTGGLVHACDLAATETFAVATNPTVEAIEPAPHGFPGGDS